MKVRKLALLAAAFLCVQVSSASDYVVPWYANPVASEIAYGDVSMTAFDESLEPLSTAWATVSEDSAHSGKTVSVKRMSHVDYFRPRLYALCSDGDVVVYTMTNDLSQIVWTTSLTAEKLASAAGVAEGSVATDLYVSDDGAYAFLKYGDEWKALEYTSPTWTLYILDSDGNSAADETTANDIWNGNVSGSLYITDGNWKFLCSRGGLASIHVGDKTATDANHIAGNLDDYSAEYLDLSRGVAQLADSAYGRIDYSYVPKITGNYKGAFASRMRVYIESHNQSMWYNSRGVWTGVEEVVQIATNVTSMGYAASMSSGVIRHVLKMAKVVEITSNGTFSNISAEETDFSDWEFPVLTNAYKRSFRYSGGLGVLSFPSLKVTSDSSSDSDAPFYKSTVEELRLSAENRTVECLGAKSFTTMSDLKRIVIGGKAGGFTFNQGDTAALMFKNCTSLEDVVFTGGHPVFTDTSLKAFDSTCNDSKARNIVFAHPPLDDATYGAEWTDFLDGKTITPLTLAERRAFKTANPGRPVPYGVVEESAFLTNYKQYIAVTGSEDEDLGVGPEIVWDDFFDDSVTVTGASEVEEGSGVYPTGSTLTLTAAAGSSGTFRRWYGDIGDNDPTSPEITVTASDDMWIYARFVHPWTVTLDDSTSGTAFNGNVRINVSNVDSDAKTLTVGKTEDYGLFTVDRVDNSDGTVSTNMTGSGVVDLGGDFLVGGVKYTATAHAAARSSMTPPPGSEITTLITPGTLGQLQGNGTFNISSSSGIKGTAYETVIMDESEITTPLTAYLFTSHQIPRIIAILPNIADWNVTSPFWGVSFVSTKLEWSDFSAAAQMHPQVFQMQWLNAPSGYASNHPLFAKRFGDATGALSLPALRGVETDFSSTSSRGSPLMMITGVEEISLGGAKRTTTVTNIGDRAFAGDTSLKKLTIHADPEITIGTNLFADNWGLDGYNVERGADGRTPDEIVFTGKAISATAMGNLLSGVNAATVKPVKVYVDRRFDDWKCTSYIDYSPTAAERAEAENGESVIGVIRAGAPSPFGKALVLHRQSPYGVSGCILIVR